MYVLTNVFKVFIIELFTCKIFIFKIKKINNNCSFNPITVNYEKLHALNPVFINVQWIFFSAAATVNESAVIALIFN